MNLSPSAYDIADESSLRERLSNKLSSQHRFEVLTPVKKSLKDSESKVPVESKFDYANRYLTLKRIQEATKDMNYFGRDTSKNDERDITPRFKDNLSTAPITKIRNDYDNRTRPSTAQYYQTRDHSDTQSSQLKSEQAKIEKSAGQIKFKPYAVSSSRATDSLPNRNTALAQDSAMLSRNDNVKAREEKEPIVTKPHQSTPLSDYATSVYSNYRSPLTKDQPKPSTESQNRYSSNPSYYTSYSSNKDTNYSPYSRIHLTSSKLTEKDSAVASEYIRRSPYEVISKPATTSGTYNSNNDQNSFMPTYLKYYRPPTSEMPTRVTEQNKPTTTSTLTPADEKVSIESKIQSYNYMTERRRQLYTEHSSLTSTEAIRDKKATVESSDIPDAKESGPSISIISCIKTSSLKTKPQAPNEADREGERKFLPPKESVRQLREAEYRLTETEPSREEKMASVNQNKDVITQKAVEYKPFETEPLKEAKFAPIKASRNSIALRSTDYRLTETEPLREEKFTPIKENKEVTIIKAIEKKSAEIEPLIESKFVPIKDNKKVIALKPVEFKTTEIEPFTEEKFAPIKESKNIINLKPVASSPIELKSKALPTKPYQPRTIEQVKAMLEEEFEERAAVEIMKSKQEHYDSKRIEKEIKNGRQIGDAIENPKVDPNDASIEPFKISSMRLAEKIAAIKSSIRNELEREQQQLSKYNEYKVTRPQSATVNLISSAEIVSKYSKKSYLPDKKPIIQLQIEEVANPDDCQICLAPLFNSLPDEPEKELSVLDRCGHLFHKECLLPYLKETITTFNFPIQCPFAGCKKEVLETDLKETLPSDLYEKFEEFSLKFYLIKVNDRIARCFTANCPYVIEMDRAGQITVLKCPLCKGYYCLKCEQLAHEPMTCEEKRALQQEDPEIVEFVKGKSLRRCNACKFWVEKTEGCNHITCRCKNEFCYLCGLKWKTCGCEQ
mgnify:FL=1